MSQAMLHVVVFHCGVSPTTCVLNEWVGPVVAVLSWKAFSIGPASCGLQDSIRSWLLTGES